ncbi:helix-turn-helix transcriptional regulator [Acidithiobacillus sp. AC3]
MSNESVTTTGRRYARPDQVAKYLGVHVSTIYRWSQECADFPKRRKIGPSASAYDLNEIDAWVDSLQES